MATVGYFEGADPAVLTKLAATGVGTIPLSNGWDNHGKYVGHLSPGDKVDVVLGPLHKVLIPDWVDLSVEDILHSCRTHLIPVFLVAPREVHAQGKKQLGTRLAKFVKLVTPEEQYDRVVEVCSACGG
jgi:hypothetical protein